MFSKLTRPAIKEVSSDEAPIMMRVTLSFPVWREGYYRLYNGRVYYQMGDCCDWMESPIAKIRRGKNNLDPDSYLIVDGMVCRAVSDIRFYGYYLDVPNRALRATDDFRKHNRSFTSQAQAIRCAKEHGIPLNHVDRIDVYRTV